MKKLLNKILVIDGSYMLHKNLRIKELWELKNKDNIKIGGTFGFLRSLNKAMYSTSEVLYPVICWDSGLNPRRLKLLPNYKNQLTKSKEYKLDKISKDIIETEDTSLLEELSTEDAKEVKEKVLNLRENMKKFGSDYQKEDYLYQYKTQRNQIIEICNTLGIPSLYINEQEGDDLITLITRIAQRSVVVTDDRDMLQLLSPTVDVNRIVNKEYLTYNEYMQKNEFRSIREMIIIKAIVGDKSDNIPSITEHLSDRKSKVGEVTAKKIARIIIENQEDPDLYVPILQNIEGRDHNKCVGFTQCLPQFFRNMELVDLSYVDNNIELIDSIISTIKTTVGTANLIRTYKILGKYQINNVDVNSISSRINQATKSAFI